MFKSINLDLWQSGINILINTSKKEVTVCKDREWLFRVYIDENNQYILHTTNGIKHNRINAISYGLGPLNSFTSAL